MATALRVLLALSLALGACSVDPATLPDASAQAPAGATPTAPSWRSAPPESQGFESSLLADALVRIRDDDTGIHGLVVARHGSVVVDAAFYPYDGTPHQVSSITKVVVGTLLGIAVDRGLVALDDPLLSYFPDRAIAHRDARKERVTLRHLANMSSGLDCTSADDEATLRAMLASLDWTGFTLDLPMTAEPGTVFRSCSPGMHLLSVVLQEATGVTALEFARQFLFEPLGISAVRWATDPQGYGVGFSDLYLLPRDMAKIGQLWLANGVWEGRRIVSEGWIDAASRPGVATGGHDGYGVGWWLPGAREGGGLLATGHGGQRLAVRPDEGLVIATAGSGTDLAPTVRKVLEALTNPEGPLLADPFGDSDLRDVVASLAAAPVAEVPGGPAATVKAISGLTWVLPETSLGLETLRLDLKGKDREGTVRMRFADSRLTQRLPIGLDGRFRVGLDRHRRPVATRGTWTEGRVFALEVDEIAAGRAFRLTLRFAEDGDRVTIEGLERGHDTGFVIEATPSD